MNSISSKDKAYLIANFADEKKAKDITILELKGLASFTDYFVICNGTSTRNVQAIADGIKEGLKKKKIRAWHMEGYKEALWILLDYSDVIAHIFYPDTREFYDLEHLWGDSPQIEYKSENNISL